MNAQPRTRFLKPWEFLYGFRDLVDSLHAWRLLMAHEIPRSILKECQQSGLLDFDGMILHGTVFEALGIQQAHRVRGKSRNAMLFSTHWDAVDYIFCHPNNFKKVRVQRRGPRRSVLPPELNSVSEPSQVSAVRDDLNSTSIPSQLT